MLEIIYLFNNVLKTFENLLYRCLKTFEKTNLSDSLTRVDFSQEQDKNIYLILFYNKILILKNLLTFFTSFFNNVHNTQLLKFRI